MSEITSKQELNNVLLDTFGDEAPDMEYSDGGDNLRFDHSYITSAHASYYPIMCNYMEDDPAPCYTTTEYTT